MDAYAAALPPDAGIAVAGSRQLVTVGAGDVQLLRYVRASDLSSRIVYRPTRRAAEGTSADGSADLRVASSDVGTVSVSRSNWRNEPRTRTRMPGNIRRPSNGLVMWYHPLVRGCANSKTSPGSCSCDGLVIEP